MKQEDINWVIACVEDKIKHLHSSPETKEEINLIKVALKEKVGWKTFSVVLSTILGLYVVISAAIWMEIKDVQHEVDRSSSEVTAISTILKQAEITK